MLFWVVIAGIAAAEVAIVVSALRMRVETDPARGILGGRPAEILWTLLPLLLLAALVVYSHEARPDMRTPSAGPAASAPAGFSLP